MLYLGKSLDRSYNIRIPFLNGFYNINIFFNKKSTFLLFNIDPDFKEVDSTQYGSKISMFKNLQSSKFCETFLNLHNYRGPKLDIVNQFDSIKNEYNFHINFILNESINLSKIDIDGKTFYDNLLIYGLTMESYYNEFVFVIVEKQNVIQRLNKKIVRSSALQIGTTSSIDLLNEFYDEYKCNKRYISDLEVDE